MVMMEERASINGEYITGGFVRGHSADERLRLSPLSAPRSRAAKTRKSTNTYIVLVSFEIPH